MKIKAWRVRQAVWGGMPEILYFRTKEERDRYVKEHDHLDVLRPCMMDASSPWWEWFYREGGGNV